MNELISNKCNLMQPVIYYNKLFYLFLCFILQISLYLQKQSAVEVRECTIYKQQKSITFKYW